MLCGSMQQQRRAGMEMHRHAPRGAHARCAHSCPACMQLHCTRKLTRGTQIAEGCNEEKQNKEKCSHPRLALLQGGHGAAAALQTAWAVHSLDPLSWRRCALHYLPISTRCPLQRGKPGKPHHDSLGIGSCHNERSTGRRIPQKHLPLTQRLFRSLTALCKLARASTAADTRCGSFRVANGWCFI